jgi:nickel-dependent lactate racemase
MSSDPPSLLDRNDNLFCAIGSPSTSLSDEELRDQISSFLDFVGEREDVLLIPPDYTRYNSQAGKLTRMICEQYKFIPFIDDNPSAEKKQKSEVALPPPKIEILPALGTHAPMTTPEIRKMYGEHLANMDPTPILVHDWRNDVVTIGHSPAEMVKKATRGMVEKPWPAQLNRKVWEKRLHDPEKQAHKSLVVSIGQVVPHEVMGMAK